MRHAAAVLLAAWALACGSQVPTRYVIEQDAGRYRFRRYQKSIDAEIPVEGNPATAHLATYVREGAPLRVAPVTVTAYTRADGLTEALRGVLRGMEGYEYGVDEREGEWLWTLKGEQQDDWLLWPSGRHLVKMGVPEGERSVPEGLLAAYLSRYPSDLGSDGKVER